MKHAFYFILGIALVILTSATTVNIMEVKPAKPVHTVVKSFRAYYGLEKDLEIFIKGKVAQGYIVKSVAVMDDEHMSKGIIVLEKY